MSSEDLLLRKGTWSAVDPTSAGWRFVSFEVLSLAPGEERLLATGDREVCLVPLDGFCSVGAEGAEWELGRTDVFAGRTGSLYLPRDTSLSISSANGAEVALCGSRCEHRREPVFIPAGSIGIEVRGSGNATRQINHIIKPDFPAERLLVVEVLTPSGNWSSYPPHKHDEENGDMEAVLEETYYFRTRPDPPGAFAVQRLYSPRHGLDLTETVRHGDVLLVPYGYHVTAAAHGYDLYYLNVLAGDRRTMACSDDPDLAWIRPAWAGLEPDPRIPLYE